MTRRTGRDKLARDLRVGEYLASGVDERTRVISIAEAPPGGLLVKLVGGFTKVFDVDDEVTVYD